MAPCLWILPWILAPGLAYGQVAEQARVSVSFDSTDVDGGESFSILDHERLSGDWGGIRSRWEQKGVTLSLEYVSTVFVNTNGGFNTSRAVEYTGNTHLTLSLDTAVLDWWDRGELFLYAEERHGSGITERHVGDYLHA